MSKTLLALVSVLAVATSTAAFAQHAKRTDRFQQAPASLNYGGVPGGEPMSYGAGHMPRAFYDQEQPGYPQSPPSGGGN